ncbi:unnamed protein product [Plutella xylostella]|uniref:(diamondback moth) hypothetical protein n=1 Tax=Plutella xylostella TaxID=51655 RepID=A0A8S4FMW8_PLUXY|nr:unnamed protein product [Plutella xylostella]
MFGSIREIYNPRASPDPIRSGPGPAGSRGGRVVWALHDTHLVVTGFDNSDEIKKSKMLFESVPTKKPPINRKNKGKEQRDLEDIVCLLRSVQTDQIPIFVARHLEKLPPVTFDHLDCTKLLKDLVKLQSEVSTIKDTYATVSQLEAVKTELHQMKHDSLPPTTMFNNINTNRRGAWTDVDSGPIGLSQCHDDDNFTSNDVINSHKIKSSTAIATLSLCDTEVRAQRDESLGGRGQPAEVALRRNIGDSSEAVGATRTMHTQGCREMASEGADSGAGGARSPVSQEASALAGSVTSLAPSSSSTAQTAAAAARQLTATDKAKLSNERVHNKLAQPLFDDTTNVNTDYQGGWQQVETWLLPHDITYISTIDSGFGYTATSAVDTSAGILRGRPYGGVALLWRHNVFQQVSVIQCNNVRICAIKITTCDRPVIIVSVYLPTNSVNNLQEFTDCLSAVSAIIDEFGVESVFIMGDGNKNVVWGTRTEEQIYGYSKECHDRLRRIDFPDDFIKCAHCYCNNRDHRRVLDGLYSDIVSALREAAVECRGVTKKAGSGARIVGWNKHVSEAHGLARSSFNMWVLCGKPRTGSVYLEICQSRRIFKSRLKWCQDNQHQIKMDSLAEKHSKGNFRGFWKDTGKENVKPSLPVSVDGKNQQKEIANVFKDHFSVKSSLGAAAEVLNADMKYGVLAAPILAKDVAKAIKCIKRGKSPGHDGLSIEHLQHAGPHISRVLAMFYSLCVSHSYLPSNFMKTVVVPVVKNKTELFYGICLLLQQSSKNLSFLLSGCTRIAGVTSAKVSERQILLYSASSLAAPLCTVGLDVSPAILQLHIDHDSRTLFLTGRGDSTIYCYEVTCEAPYLCPLSHHRCARLHQGLSFLQKNHVAVEKVEFARALRLTNGCIEPLSFTVPRIKGLSFLQKNHVAVEKVEFARALRLTNGCIEPLSFTVPRIKGLSFLQKNHVAVEKVEFARALRLTNGCIEPLSFTVPRIKSELFQDDLFPPTLVTWEPWQEAKAWFASAPVSPRLHSLQPPGMESLSAHSLPSPQPKEAKEKERAVQKPKPDLIKSHVPYDPKDKQDSIMKSMSAKVQVNLKLEQDNMEGVDETEWEQ